MSIEVLSILVDHAREAGIVRTACEAVLRADPAIRDAVVEVTTCAGAWAG